MNSMAGCCEAPPGAPTLALASTKFISRSSPLNTRSTAARAGATAGDQYAGSAVQVSRKAAPVSTALYLPRSIEYLGGGVGRAEQGTT